MSGVDPRLGVLAFGDSITNGGGELQWGVALQSWALWTARGLGLPYTGYAVDGARARDLVAGQLPAFTARASDPDGPYDVGCLYIGVNDVRAPDFDATAFADDLDEAAGFLAARCTRVLCLTPPCRLGRPRARAERLAAVGTAVRASAQRHGALVLSLEQFGARNQVMADHVHPTAFGQVAIAQQALAMLAADGMTVRVDPATLVAPSHSRVGALRGDAAYAWRDLKARAGAAWWSIRSG